MTVRTPYSSRSAPTSRSLRYERESLRNRRPLRVRPPDAVPYPPKSRKFAGPSSWARFPLTALPVEVQPEHADRVAAHDLVHHVLRQAAHHLLGHLERVPPGRVGRWV